MSKQLINIGTLPNDNTGDPIRDGGDKINDNFNEIYGAIGDGSTLSIDVSNPVNGEALIYNSSTGKFESNSIGAVLSTLTITDDSSSSIGIDLTTDQLDVTGGLGIVSSVTGTQLKLDIDQSIVITQTGTETLSNKTLDGLSNTFTNIPNSALVNSELTIMDSTSTTDSVALGETLHITGGSTITTSVANNVLTIDLAPAFKEFTIRDSSSTTDTVALGETLHITGSNAITTSIANNVLTIDLAPVSKCTTLGTTVLELGCTTTCLEGLTCFDLASGAEMRLRGYHPLGRCNVAIGTTADIPNAANAGCNVSIGYNALCGIVDGTNNVAVGTDALCGISDGYCNVAIGKSVLKKAAHGWNNVAIGASIMGSMCAASNCNVSCNIMLGLSLFDSTNPNTFSRNIVLGQQSGNCIQSNAQENVIIGRCNFRSAVSNTSYNVAIGRGASGSATGNDNISIGSSAGSNSLTGYQIAIGRSAASRVQTCSDCWQCTGANSLTTGNPPAVCSSYSGIPNWSSNNKYGCNFEQTANLAIGNFAMNCVMFADTNVVIGHNAAAATCNNTLCGVDTGLKDSVVLGNTSAMNNTLEGSIVIGNRAFTCMCDMSSVHSGNQVPTLAHSFNDVIIGTDALQSIDANSCSYGCNSCENVVLGAYAAQYVRGLSGSVIIGACAYQCDFTSPFADDVTTGVVVVGEEGMGNFSSPDYAPHITSVGAGAGFYTSSGQGITLVGTNAFGNNSLSAYGMVVVGDNAHMGPSNGDVGVANNTIVGSNAANSLHQGCSSINRTGFNTIIGSHAATGLTSFFSGPLGPSWCSSVYDLQDGCNNIIIGYAAAPSAQIVDDEITIGNPANTKFRLPGVQASAVDGQVLTHNASTGYLELQNAGGGTLNVIDDSSTAVAITLSTEQLQIAGGAGITTSASGNTITISNSASGSLSVLDDSSTSISIDLGTESLTLVGGTGITTSASGNTVTIAKSSNSYSTQKFTGDESTSAFTLNQSGRTVDDVFVIVNGIVLVPTDDYTILGTTLTFVLAPGASSEIQVRYLPL